MESMDRETGTRWRIPLARARKIISRRGNDGLTARERKLYADRYRAGVVRTMTPMEADAMKQWLKVRREKDPVRDSRLV